MPYRHALGWVVPAADYIDVGAMVGGTIKRWMATAKGQLIEVHCFGLVRFDWMAPTTGLSQGGCTATAPCITTHRIAPHRAAPHRADPAPRFSPASCLRMPQASRLVPPSTTGTSSCGASRRNGWAWASPSSSDSS